MNRFYFSLSSSAENKFPFLNIMEQSKLASLLSTLYSSTDNASIQAASQQLNVWQQSSESWTQVDHLLSTPGLQTEFYYFFAQTLKTKIQYDMYQVPENSFLGLRDSIIQKLLALPESPAAKPARKQLCLAIADLAIQAIEVWNTAIPDLVNALEARNPRELFEILKLIPEETENLRLMTENGKRNLSRQKCLEYYYSVLELLGSKFQTCQNVSDLGESIMACFLAWLKFDSPPIQYALAESPILNYCLGTLSDIGSANMTTNETAIDVLIGIIETTSSYRQRSQHNPLIELKIFPSVSVVCKTLLQLDLTRALHSDENTLKTLTRLIVVTASGMMHAIAQKVPQDSQIQELILLIIRLLSLNHLEISESTCAFFEDFLEATVPSGHPQASLVHERLFETAIARMDIATEDSFNECDPFKSVDSDFLFFRSHGLCPLVSVLCRDFYGKPLGAEKILRGLIHHAVNTAGSSLTIKECFAYALKGQLYNVRDPSASLIEAVDFLIDSIQGWIDAGSIHSCSLLHAFWRRSLLALVGSLGPWVRTEPQLFRLIDAVAQVLIRPSVVHPALHVAAADSFQELCFNSHTKGMIAKNPGALQSVTKLFNQTVGHLALREHSQVTEGITSVLAACEDDGIFNTLLSNMILTPLLQSLESCRCAKDVGNCGIVVDRLMAVFRSLKKLRPGTSRFSTIGDLAVHSMWVSLAKAMEDFRSDSEFIEKACRLLKHTLRCIPCAFKQILVPLGQVIVRDFSIAQHSSYLYTAEILAHEFGQDPDTRFALSELFASLASEGARIAHQRMTSTQFGVDTVDELIEDLYGMIERFIRNSPTIVVKSRQALQAIITLLVPVFSRIRRSETIEAVSAFTEQLYHGEWTHGDDIGTVSNEDVIGIKRALFDIAPSLVMGLFDLLASVCSRTMRESIPSILMAINGFDHEHFRNDWLIRGLQRLPANVMTERDKQEAVVALCSLDDDRRVIRCVQDILYRAELVGRRVRNEMQ